MLAAAGTAERATRIFGATCVSTKSQVAVMTTPRRGRLPDATAHVTYTSGSTGVPKGVISTHSEVANYIEWMQSEFRLLPSDRVLFKAPISFDVAYWEILWPLCVGAAVVVAPAGSDRDPERLARLMESFKVTVAQFVPSALGVFATASALGTCPSLRMLFTGGEALTPALRDRVFDYYTGDFHKLYGPTEASIFCCHAPIVNDRAGWVSIGRPIRNAEMHVLDAELRPVPRGVAGELFIGGEGLATGYNGRPAETAERFLPSPFDPFARLYRTGDRARYLPDGRLLFLGRTDRQLKIRGHRVEPGEIEACLDAHPAVQRSVVVHNADTGAGRLIAYIESPEVPRDLAGFLAERLPRYLLPQSILAVGALPRLGNGKIDVNRLAALPVPRAAHPALSSYTASERMVADIWNEVIGPGKFDLDDNFFDVGGQSLLLLAVRDLLAKKIRQTVKVTALYEHPTLRGLARYLETMSHPTDEGAAIAARARLRQAARQSNARAF